MHAYLWHALCRHAAAYPQDARYSNRLSEAHIANPPDNDYDSLDRTRRHSDGITRSTAGSRTKLSRTRSPRGLSQHSTSEHRSSAPVSGLRLVLPAAAFSPPPPAHRVLLPPRHRLVETLSAHTAAARPVAQLSTLLHPR